MDKRSRSWAVLYHEDTPGDLLTENSGAWSADIFDKIIHQREVRELSSSGRSG